MLFTTYYSWCTAELMDTTCPVMFLPHEVLTLIVGFFTHPRKPMCCVMWQELRKRKLIVSGKKHDLAARLLDSIQSAQRESIARALEETAAETGHEDDGQELELTDHLTPEDVDHLTVRPSPCWRFWSLCAASSDQIHASSASCTFLDTAIVAPLLLVVLNHR